MDPPLSSFPSLDSTSLFFLAIEWAVSKGGLYRALGNALVITALGSGKGDADAYPLFVGGDLEPGSFAPFIRQCNVLLPGLSIFKRIGSKLRQSGPGRKAPKLLPE